MLGNPNRSRHRVSYVVVMCIGAVCVSGLPSVIIPPVHGSAQYRDVPAYILYTYILCEHARGDRHVYNVIATGPARCVCARAPDVQLIESPARARVRATAQASLFATAADQPSSRRRAADAEICV